MDPSHCFCSNEGIVRVNDLLQMKGVWVWYTVLKAVQDIAGLYYILYSNNMLVPMAHNRHIHICIPANKCNLELMWVHSELGVTLRSKKRPTRDRKERYIIYKYIQYMKSLDSLGFCGREQGVEVLGVDISCKTAWKSKGHGKTMVL